MIEVPLAMVASMSVVLFQAIVHYGLIGPRRLSYEDPPTVTMTCVPRSNRAACSSRPTEMMTDSLWKRGWVVKDRGRYRQVISIAMI